MTLNSFGQPVGKHRVSATEVKNFHDYDDVDASKRSHHHTLGMGLNQAAQGSKLAQAFDLIVELQALQLRVGDMVLSVRADETTRFKLCNGQTLVGDQYDELEAVNGSLTLPDLTADGNYFMRVL